MHGWHTRDPSNQCDTDMAEQHELGPAGLGVAERGGCWGAPESPSQLQAWCVLRIPKGPRLLPGHLGRGVPGKGYALGCPGCRAHPGAQPMGDKTAR